MYHLGKIRLFYQQFFPRKVAESLFFYLESFYLFITNQN